MQLFDSCRTVAGLINKIEAGRYYGVYACDDVSCSAQLAGRMCGLGFNFTKGKSFKGGRVGWGLLRIRDSYAQCEVRALGIASLMRSSFGWQGWYAVDGWVTAILINR